MFFSLTGGYFALPSRQKLVTGWHLHSIVWRTIFLFFVMEDYMSAWSASETGNKVFLVAFQLYQFWLRRMLKIHSILLASRN
ncbi:hypothetical protein C9422_17310 [Pseudomonas sp. B1(2018)]|nr:hypothetical protein C9422_17310 [Pseudomonas sp. B1(2018)]